MKKIIILIFVIFSIVFLRLVSSFLLNEYIIHNYNKGIYKTNLIKILYVLNFNQSYIVYYNDGNISYKLGDFNEAITKYNNSLKHNPPKSRICDVRINLSLAMVNNINTDDNSEKIRLLEEAQNVLYKDGCANKDDSNGYSSKAEDLDDKITEMINKLNESNSNNDNYDDNNIEIEQDDYLENELKDIQKDAQKSRYSGMTSYENIGSYSYYSGKRW